MEQVTYLFFMKLLDDKQRQREAIARVFGSTLDNPAFKEGAWHNPDTE